ncbi:thymidylate synthase (FAD) [Rhodoblastus acidophilus]|uniref:FAD-dependent thymidylate synthase n=1 Tax=Rhodoblastus acidophilus TaxID=1074 RepID=UPI0022243627|nr:FAD-dependent thymidylate synthase [Rhodoblastus acidophilus]MCW2286647.1 thymidylate synthase (FAD) [Rhodoblastus acidophilus]MCW2335583.1 thymidylate synthase (FAD) [Rhodoblastus acidophilus]
MKAELINYMGDDLSVVNAARVSFDKTSTWETVHVEPDPDDPYDWGGCYDRLSEKDTKLIQFLAKHNHWTPFAHTAISLRMQAPVPIRTQCFKHKQGLVENEESRRYIKSTPQVYYPDVWRSKPEGNAKQGSAGPVEHQQYWRNEYQSAINYSLSLYEEMIEAGVCPEQARFVLPQGCEVNWVWTGNLYSFANFYNKRTDPHAQKEVQDLAKEVGRIIEPLFPVSWKALTNG